VPAQVLELLSKRCPVCAVRGAFTLLLELQLALDGFGVAAYRGSHRRSGVGGEIGDRDRHAAWR